MFCLDKSQRVTFEAKRHGVVIVVSFCCPALSQSTLTSMPFSMRFSTRCRADIDVPLPLSWKISITIATFIFISSLSYSLLRQSFYGNILTYASYVYYNTNKKNRKDFSIVSQAVKQLKQRLYYTQSTVFMYYSAKLPKIVSDMEDKKVDRRIAKTKKAIYRAFAELLSKKNVNDITIKDIADRADINRKTFYNYYDGIYELIGEIENTIIDNFEKVIRKHNVNDILRNPNLMYEELTSIINSDPDFYQHLISIESNSNLVKKLVLSLKTRAKEVISEYTVLDESTLDIVLDFVVSGMFTVFQHWFNSSKERPLDDLARIVANLSYNGINGIVKDFENK